MSIEQLTEDLNTAKREIQRLNRLLVKPDTIADLTLLHPIAVSQFQELYKKLLADFKSKKTYSEFHPFETYRTAQRQRQLFKSTPRVTHADAFESAHQFGLAVDFIPKTKGNFNWANSEDWGYLHEAAISVGLSRPISWDKGHIEHPIWKKISKLI